MSWSKIFTVLLVSLIANIMFVVYIRQGTNMITCNPQPMMNSMDIMSTAKMSNDTNRQGRTIMSEEEAFRIYPCSDPRNLPSATKSSVKIIDSFMDTYNLGDKIRVLVQLNNGFGKRIKEGGHLIHSTMSNSRLGAYSTGIVTDYLNGTYLFEFEALWTGTSVINVVIDYAREAIAASYRLRHMYLTLNTIMGTYTKGTYKETVLCHPDAKRLIAEAHYKDVCNFTALNSGHQWYCGSPINSNLHCNDWHFTNYYYVKTKFPLTDCENVALLGVHKKIPHNLSVKVYLKNVEMSTLDEIVMLPKQSCVKYNTTHLWYNTGRTGFFYREQWILRHCQGVDVKIIPRCLKDTIVYLIGDSTVRQWYVDIMHRFKCKQYTETWTTSTWSHRSACLNEDYNFTTVFDSHNFPYNAAVSEKSMSARLTSVTKKLEMIPSNQNAIVLIHIYTHLWGYHHRYFREKMMKLREGVERLIQRNSLAKVLLKIPHTFTYISSNGGRSDISGYVFIDVMKDVFKGVYDKIIYLDNREASTAVNSENVHPDNFVVRGMVNQMFSYVCE